MTAIRVELQLADGSFTTGMLRAGQTLAAFQRQLIATNPQMAAIAARGGDVIRTMTRMDGTTKGFLGTLRDVSIVTGLVSFGLSKLTGAANGWAGEIVRINAEMERLTYQMKAMSTASNPMKEAADNVKYLREQAAQMPFSLKTLTSGFVKLKATGTDPTNGSLKAIADGIAAFGGTDESFNRTILGITQAAGKGVLQMEELRQQIGESMPIAMQLLARSMGLTVGQLAKEIQTGTVAARPALEMLYKELDRAYGGTSQRMMQTFSGQITQLHTNLQNLATSEGGKGFFDQVKAQLVDINRFLQGDMAQKLAVTFGQGLASIVQGLRSAVTMVWEFRDEIARTAMAIGTGIGVIALSRGLTTLTTTLKTSAMAFSLFRVNMASAMADVALGISGFRNLGTAAIGAQIAAGGLGRAVGAALTGLAGMAPLIIGVGMAAYGAAEYFGLLSDRTKDAYEELVKYGAESRKVAEDIVNNRRNQLNSQLAAIEKVRPSAAPGAWDDKIAEIKKQLRELDQQAPQLINDASRRQGEKDLAKFREDISEVVAEQQRLYNETQTERDRQYNADLDAAGTTEQSKAELRKKYEADTLANMKRLSESIIKEYDRQEEALVETLKSGDAQERRNVQSRLSFLRESRIAEFNKLKELDDYKFGAPKTAAGGDEKAAVQRGSDTLNRLKQDIASLQAEIGGASGAMAELNARIAQNEFGSIKEGGAAVAELHEQLREATAAKEALDKVMEGRKKIERDIENVRVEAIEREMELLERQQGKELNAAEKVKLRLDNSFYEGLGPLANIRKAIDSVVMGMNTQGEAANQLARVMQQNTFGDETVRRVDSVAAAMNRLAQSINGVGTGLNGVNFATFGTDLGAAINGTIQPVMQNLPGQVTDRMKQAMDYMMQKGWSREAAAGIVGNLVAESNMNPNAIGDNGNAFGLAQWNDRGPAMKAWLASQGKAWNDFFGQLDFIDHELRGSEARAGSQLRMARDANAASQIVMNEYERPAMWARQKTGGERAGAAQQAYNMAAGGNVGQMPMPAGQLPVYQPPQLMDLQIQKTEEYRNTLDTLDKKLEDLAARESDMDLSDWIKETKTQTKELGENADEAGRRYKTLVKEIAAGKFGTSAEDRNPEAERYKLAIEAAKEYDRVDAEVAEKKKTRGQVENEAKKLEEERLELNRRLAEAQKKASDPNYLPDSSEIQRLTTDLDAYVKKVLELNGGDTNSAAYKQALETRTNMLRGQRQLEALESQTAFNKETQDLRNNLMTQTQLRQYELQKALAGVDAWVEQQRKAGMDEVEITRMAEEKKALIRQQYAQQMNPMAQQMQQWGDLQGQLAQASTRWMDSLAGGITDLIMGTGDLRSVIQGILKDIVNMGVKYLMSGMMQGKNGSAPAAKGAKGAKGGQAAAAGKGKLAPGLFHTGGIIGAGGARPSKMVSSALFSGAPKFHTGGIVDGLLPSEVPIIAKKGEGVFTPEQMEAMGGLQQNQAFQINAPITVNGSAGTPEQNTDLAQKMAKQMEQSMRGVIADEIRKQTKPGNFMNNRSR